MRRHIFFIVFVIAALLCVPVIGQKYGHDGSRGLNSEKWRHFVAQRCAMLGLQHCP